MSIMLAISPDPSLLKGGGFLLRNPQPEEVFVPEEWNEEQQMIAETASDFLKQELHALGPLGMAELDAAKDRDFVIQLLEKAGELGLCGISIEEQYGGIDLDFNTGLLVGEGSAAGFSFGTTIGAQTSIGSLPIVYYGTPEQKAKYLPGIADASLKTCYCLTEPTAGSDANSGRTKAIQSPDGSYYTLTGQKMWITNGGFADLFIVFAKIDDDKDLSAFIVEKAFGGITIGKEEKKMGIKASSTVQIFFNEVRVPAENLIAGRGEGFKIALNILNTGRIKLASAAVGGSKVSLALGVQYAAERRQFDQPIVEFGAVMHKIGEIAAQTFIMESAVYRTGFNIDRKCEALARGGMPPDEAKRKAVREYAIECALLKVRASEALDYAVDETLQIHGGMGYSMDTGIEMGYRDARIMRIFEGTNEINRLLSVAELTKRALKTKELDLISAGKKVPGRILRQLLPFRPHAGDRAEERLVQNFKTAFLLISGAAGRKLGKKMVEEQEIVMQLSDILAEAYLTESALLRVRKLRRKPDHPAEILAIQEKMLQVWLYEARQRVRKAGTNAIMSYATGQHRRLMLWMLRLLTPRFDVNPKALRRDISRFLVARDGKWFT